MLTKEDIEAINDGQMDLFQYWGIPQPPAQVDPRDKTPLDMVKEYAETANQKPNQNRAATLVDEEFQEWLHSPAGTADELKELTDLVYVIYGYANTMGWDLDLALLRVHDNNMGRMHQPDGTIKRREDGKIMKNEDYPKVVLEDLV